MMARNAALASVLLLLLAAVYQGAAAVFATTDIDALPLLNTSGTAVRAFKAQLSGAKQVPPLGKATAASGTSRLRISPDYSSANLTLTVKAVQGYFMSHIHAGNATTSGPIVLWINPSAASLLPSPPQYINIGAATFSVAFTADDLVGPLEGSTNLLPLAELARGNGVYANVHTLAYPEGVIRGQF